MKVWHLLILLIVVAVTSFVFVTALRQPAPVPMTFERPYLCLVPYSNEYCQAHQDKMYREQAMRAR